MEADMDPSTDRITFKCNRCGHPLQVDKNAMPKDDDIVVCRGCGQSFGTYAEVKKGIVALGKREVERLIDSADLPPWIRRTPD